MGIELNGSRRIEKLGCIIGRIDWEDVLGKLTFTSW